MPQSVARHTALIRIDAPQTELDALVEAITSTRGVHAVEVKVMTEYNRELGKVEPTGWRKIWFRGTERGVMSGKNQLAFSGLQELDSNADHDHVRCIEDARKMDVPAAWAHTPETYLSM